MDFEGKVFWGFAETLPSRKASRIKVMGEKKKNRFFRLSDENIKSTFPPEGKVFLPQASDSYCYFQIEEEKLKKDEKNDYFIVVQGTLRPMNRYCLIRIEALKFRSLSPEIIQEITSITQTNYTRGTYYFFLSNENEIIGPFDNNENEFRPKQGKEALVFDASFGLEELIFEKDNEYDIFFNPPEKIFKEKNQIDCMSNDQLKEWFRLKLKEANAITSEEENAIKIIMRMLKDKVFQYANDLDTVRFERMDEMLDQFEFSYDQLKDILKKDDFKILRQKIDNMRSEIKKEELQSLSAEIKSLDKEKLYLQNEKEGILSNIENLKSEKNIIENDVKYLTNNYDSLLQQLKLNANIGLHEEKSKNKVIKPTVLEIQKEGKTFKEINADEDNKNDMDLYYHLFGKNLNRMNYNETIMKLIKSEDYSILRSQAIFIPCISWAYIYTQGIGNAKIYSMHLEHDWLHYRDFCNNGLLDIWNEAWNKYDKNIILVLENINITQPECGINPLLDVINGYRPVLEGTDKGLPDNLKIFATRLPSNEENIGLKLSRQSFIRWGTFGDPSDLAYKQPVEIKQANLFGYFEPDDIKKINKNTPSGGDKGVYFEIT